jgi:hypothetical protein
MEETANIDLDRIKDLESQLTKAHASIKNQTKEVNKLSRSKDQLDLLSQN